MPEPVLGAGNHPGIRPMVLPHFSLRESRTISVKLGRWRRRLIFVIGGIAVGLAAVGLTISADYAQKAFQLLVERWPYAPMVVTPLGFGLAVWLAVHFFPNTQGSGIPQAIAARKIADPRARNLLVGARVAVGKVILTLLGLLVGASTGREGPTVQVGASVMSFIGQRSPRRQPDLILAGAAAGIAAAFNAPLAGVVFAIEEMSRSFELRTSGLIVGGIVVAGLTAQILLGDYTYFGFTGSALPLGTAWLAVPLCGVVGGLFGGVFSRMLVTVPDQLPKRAASWITAHPVWFATLCGLGVALCGLATGGDTFGTGYEQARHVLHENTDLPIIYAPLKLIATALSAVSGVPGGIFSPSLSVGAALGAEIARLFDQVTAAPIVLLGMVAYFTGVVRAPITGFVIVSEMSDNHSMLVALMATALIADASASLINRDGVYQELSVRFFPKPKP
ncbi:H+/Cl- antiporter ClcA [Hyphomicrobium sp. 1Nfss2.1]|uniref:chloride channel protein n=1 Tax=Hyphomicrobium sp. 1Nfss2.1 TaxID=3413936 RepID=UPI003C79D219